MYVHLDDNVNNGNKSTNRINEYNKDTVIRTYTHNCNYIPFIFMLFLYHNINFKII